MITIKTYCELNEYFDAFASKKLNLMVVVSRGGLGKTFLAEETLAMLGPLFFSGHVTPLKMYKELYNRNREENDFVVVYDDVDTLLNNKTNIALLKQVCDTRETKTIQYCTSSPILKVPQEFETHCKVLMLMNNLETEDKNVNALMTRAHFIHFEPSDVEVIKHISTFGKDKQIIEFIKMYAPFSRTLNLRVYKRAEELKNASLDWKRVIIDELEIDSRLYEVNKLIKKYKTDSEREKHFSESRSTFYRFKRLLTLKNPSLK